MILIGPFLNDSFSNFFKTDISYLYNLAANLAAEMSQSGYEKSSKKEEWFLCLMENCAFCRRVFKFQIEQRIEKHLNIVHKKNPNFGIRQFKEIDMLSLIFVLDETGKIGSNFREKRNFGKI